MSSITIGIRTTDRWHTFIALLAALRSQELDFPLLIVDQSESVPPEAVMRVMSTFRETHWVRVEGKSWWDAREALYENVRAEYLLQLDDDVIPLLGSFLALVNEMAEDVAFVQACTKNIGEPDPPDSPDIEFPNYQRWLPNGSPLLLAPNGYCSRFALVDVEKYHEATYLLSTNKVYQVLEKFKGHGADDAPIGAAWRKLGYRGLVVPNARGFHLCVDSGTFNRSVVRVRGRVLDALLLHELGIKENNNEKVCKNSSVPHRPLRCPTVDC